MKFQNYKFFILLKFVNFTLSSPIDKVHCRKTYDLVTSREKILNTLDRNTSVNFIVDFAVLNENLLLELYEKMMAREDQIFKEPINIIEVYKNFYYFVVKLDSSRFQHLSKILNSKKYFMFIDQNLLIPNKNCINDGKNIKVYQMFSYSNSTGCSMIMQSCKVTKENTTSEKYEISKEILITTKGQKMLTFLDIMRCTVNGIKMRNLTFQEFYVKGFCICDYLEYYLNDCPEEIVKKEKIDLTILSIVSFFGVVTLILIIIDIYECIIEQNE
ncbi:hypothetical protein PVAND_001480 [Polypedilum vanderplanki]|uniref:Uncharacterized protein n=1 Tax=Polypedilum vanderplanki TaxID=319348 RepID=A0A9J6BNB7_POLVA|nr:hypothetical protein PVAND_001480 [Polypedilum vanderplanki]